MKLTPNILRTIHYSFHVINKTTRISVLGLLERFWNSNGFWYRMIKLWFHGIWMKFHSSTRWWVSVVEHGFRWRKSHFMAGFAIRYAFHYYCIRSKWPPLCTIQTDNNSRSQLIFMRQWVINLFVHSFATHLLCCFFLSALKSIKFWRKKMENSIYFCIIVVLFFPRVFSIIWFLFKHLI